MILICDCHISGSSFVLTATYCTTIFALMLLSLLETILVMHLMEKDSRSQENEETDCRTAKDFDQALPLDEVSSQKVCSYYDVLQHLNVSKNNEIHTLTRPVLDHTKPTDVYLEVAFYAILDMLWHSDLLSWDPKDFCNITTIPSVPDELIWKPDIIIKEMTDLDKAPPTPYLTLYSNGTVHQNKGMVVVTTCKMNIYSFPFDTQRCNLSFNSITNTDFSLSSNSISGKELKLIPADTSKLATLWTREVLQTQDEWEFCNVKVTNSNSEDVPDVIVFTVCLYVLTLTLTAAFDACYHM
ncbi:5-hydroxytryptamine receptor 3A [Merluccius polli]|uniref:5-hydroxytryptamine receptor 3A n=1 Tax=Merluccius polli TaxID=89951 RepID=A0AA47M5Y9_MERPO|nr:5-hydroxytryptamine receptor 3A [Merluccius polli]